MKLCVLGCSAGIGGRYLRTTSFLVDGDVLIDAGTGVEDLSLAKLSLIDYVLVSHSHLDHVSSLPFLVDTVGGMRTKAITVYTTRATIEILGNHLFTWAIWPDFSEIPTLDAPYLRYQEIEVGKTMSLAGRRPRPLPAEHTVPAVGFDLASGHASMVFTGDTGSNDALWKLVNRIRNLRYVIIETAFSNKERQFAEDSKHLWPTTLTTELAKFEGHAEIYITHLKPGEIELTMQEIEECAGTLRPRMLQNGQLFEL